MYYRLCKKNSKFWISFLVIFFLFAGCNDSKWDSLNNKAIDLYNQAKYDEGLQVAKKALEIADFHL